VGPVTERKLAAMAPTPSVGVTTVAKLAQTLEEELRARFGRQGLFWSSNTCKLDLEAR
jgi:nucleotidyltransferase/DNA polymerase involved in DNA repair